MVLVFIRPPGKSPEHVLPMFLRLFRIAFIYLVEFGGLARLGPEPFPFGPEPHLHTFPCGGFGRSIGPTPFEELRLL